MFEISILLYIIGIIILSFSIKNTRVSILFIWPYLIYGTGLAFSAYNYQNEIFTFTNIYDYYNIYIAQGIMLSFLIIVYLLDNIFFKKNYLAKKFSDIKRINVPIVVKIVNSTMYQWYMFFQGVILLCLIVLAWTSGEIRIGEYDYTAFASLKYWGAIGFFVENIVIGCSLYLYTIFFWKDKVKRNKYLEVFILLVLLFRLTFGTRLFLAKLIIFMFLIYLINEKKYFRILKWVILLMIFLSLMALFRLGTFNTDDISSIILGSVFLEAYFNDLTLLIATQSFRIEDFYYQPMGVISFFSSLLPNFIFDREEFRTMFLDSNLIMSKLGVDTLSPVGAMSFFAQSIYVFGEYYIVVFSIVLVIIMLFIKNIKSSYGVFFLLACGEIIINLWRDSYGIFIKIFFVHLLLNMIVMYFISKFKYKKDEM